MLFEASSAVTVKLKDIALGVLAGALTEKCVAIGTGGGCGGGAEELPLPPPHPLRRLKLEARIRNI